MIAYDAIVFLRLLTPSKKSSGLDGISERLLKGLAYNIARPLVNVFNLSLQTAMFPDDWKMRRLRK